MAERYKHGVTAEFADSISMIPAESGTNAIYVGTAPVNLVRDWKKKDVVNFPVNVTRSNMQAKLGYSKDWKSFTLCEAMKAHFDNGIQAIGPIVAINVLDPDKHKKEEPVTEELLFVNDYARIKSGTIILDTLVLADMVEGVDFTTRYDFETETLEIHRTGENKAERVRATYSEVDPSLVTVDDVVGSVTEEGEYRGMDCVSLVYPELELIPNVLAAPGHSHQKAVYDKMVKTAQKINGHWDCFVVADIPIEGVGTKEKAIEWKEQNGYEAETSKVCWPKWKAGDGTVYHLSTLAVWAMLYADALNDDVPMESPSNMPIISGKQYFGEDSKNRGYDQQQANGLNEKGITTAVYWGGYTVLWGPHTAAYGFGNVLDKRVIFDNSIRMMMHVSNSFQEDHAMEIDAPMTKAMADTIKAKEQEKADALASMGALIGDPVVEFEEEDNGLEDLVEGNFVWRNKITPTPPFKSGHLKVAYTDEGFSSYYEGGE